MNNRRGLTRSMYICTMADALASRQGEYYISTRHLPAASFLTGQKKFSRFPESQEQALSKRLHKMSAYPPLRPISGLCGRYAGQSYKLFFISPNFLTYQRNFLLRICFFSVEEDGEVAGAVGAYYQGLLYVGGLGGTGYEAAEVEVVQFGTLHGLVHVAYHFFVVKQ